MIICFYLNVSKNGNRNGKNIYINSLKKKNLLRVFKMFFIYLFYLLLNDKILFDQVISKQCLIFKNKNLFLKVYSCSLVIILKNKMKWRTVFRKQIRVVLFCF